MPTGVAERRRQLGLSQTQLASASKLSRQLISAVETGRHVPSVKAALAMAEVLGATVEEVFGDFHANEHFVSVLGGEPREGAGVAAVRVGESVVYNSLSNTGPSWARADGVYRAGRVELFGDSDSLGLAVAGCDPALGLAASLLPGRGPRRIVDIPTSSGNAIKALDEGRLHGALVHGQPGHLRKNSLKVRRFTLARWKVGLGARPGYPVDLERIAKGEIRTARRDPGAEVQRALERALEQYGGAGRINGPTASGHLDSARQVVYGSADVAVTMEAAARAYGLDFHELEEHVSEIRFVDESVDLPGAEAFLDLMASRPFLARLEALGGYDVTEAGRPA
jgi:DNA-binding XRE family transcriptional regulator